MAKSELSAKLLDELRALELLPDERIDVSDIPEIDDWRDAVRGAFVPTFENRNYDVRGLANWCLRRAKEAGKTVTNLSLNKLIYFLVERALVEKRILLTPAKIEAWDHGPVFREIYHSLKNLGEKAVTSPLQRYSVADRKLVEAEQVLTEGDEVFLTSVLDNYLQLTASQLVRLSHVSGGAWDLVWNHKSRTNFGMEIPAPLVLLKAAAKRPKNERR